MEAAGSKATMGPVNVLFHSLFRQADLVMNDTLVAASGKAYPYRAYLTTLLSYRDTYKERWVACIKTGPQMKRAIMMTRRTSVGLSGGIWLSTGMPSTSRDTYNQTCCYKTDWCPTTWTVWCCHGPRRGSSSCTMATGLISRCALTRPYCSTKSRCPLGAAAPWRRCWPCQVSSTCWPTSWLVTTPWHLGTVNASLILTRPLPTMTTLIACWQYDELLVIDCTAWWPLTTMPDVWLVAAGSPVWSARVARVLVSVYTTGKCCPLPTSLSVAYLISTDRNGLKNHQVVVFH